MNEFCIEWLRGSDYAGVTAPSGSALKTKLLRLADEKPNEVKIKAINKDGSIFVHVPIKYIKVSPPRIVSDEQREAFRQRIIKMHTKRRKGLDSLN